MKTFTFMATAGAVCFAVASAFAGTAYDNGGVVNGTSATETTVLSQTQFIVKTQSSYDTFTMNDPDHPYNAMSGECFGSFEINVPGASGGGNCVFSNEAGEMTATRFSVTGMASDGAITGTWTVTGGTGQFAGATGGGLFSSMTDREAGTFENTVTGAMILK